MTELLRRRVALAGPAFAIGAVAAILVGAAHSQTQDRPATSDPPEAAIRAHVLPRVARVQASEPGDGRVEQASGFVIDRYNRLVLTSCRILFAKRETLSFEVEFGDTPSVKRAADALLCNPALDLAVVRVRAFDIEFPRSINPSSADRTWPGDGLYVLGFASGNVTVVPVIADVTDTELPELPGRFIGTRSKLPEGAPDVEDALHALADLSGGPLVNAQGNLVGVNAFSGGEHIRNAQSGVELPTVPKGTYFARTVETIAPLVRQALAIRP
jgi:S1-C subfamily serine protease